MNNASNTTASAQAQSRTRRVKAGRDTASEATSTVDPVAANTPPQHAERVAEILARKAKAAAKNAEVAKSTSTQAAEEAKPAAKPRAKIAKVAPVANAAAEAAGGAQPAEQQTASAFERLNAAYEDVMASFKLPTWKRTLVASVLSIGAACGCGYLIGQVTAALMIGAFAMTGSGFLSWVIFALACVVSFYVGMKVAGKVATYVMTEQIDRDIAAVKNKIAGWLNFGAEVTIEKVAHA